jgi:hypothetical protein
MNDPQILDKLREIAKGARWLASQMRPDEDHPEQRNECLLRILSEDIEESPMDYLDTPLLDMAMKVLDGED